MKTRIIDFFNKHLFNLSQIDAGALLNDFATEMQKGLTGADSSLAMIPAFVTVDNAVPANKPVIVVDAGGTNLRVCIVQFNGAGVPEISHFSKQLMPGVNETVTSEQFFSILAEKVAPLLQYADDIGFCFSYAAEITPDCDGRLIRWSKQIKAPEVEGQMVGAELKARLAPLGFKGKITVLNDTVATLLAGKSASITRPYCGYVGFILGTGTNTATIVNNSEITKCSGLPAGAMIINTESGSFNKAPRSDFDKLFGDATMDPDAYWFEKSVSGGYLGGLGYIAIKTAAEEGIFSENTCQSLLSLPTLENKDLDDFCDNPFISEGPLAKIDLTDDDRLAIQMIGNEVYKRAALFTAVNVAAAIIKSGGGKSPLTPVCVNVDGSTFHKTKSVEFRSRVEAKLREILEPQNISYSLIQIEDSPIIGAAVAGLTR